MNTLKNHNHRFPLRDKPSQNLSRKKIFIAATVLLVGATGIAVSKNATGPLAVGKAWQAAGPLQELGYHLYFDERLSLDSSVSCNTCHNVLHGANGTDSLPTSKGIGGQFGGRNSPTVWNAKLLSVQFWDGRAKDLAEQAKGPIINPVEMGMPSHAVAVERIAKIPGYQKAFAKAFPKEKSAIHIDNIARAIAAFEESLVSTDSPYDNKKLSPAAQAGEKLFSEVGCIACHSGKAFAGPELPVGTGFYMKFPSLPDSDLEKKYGFSQDLGRYEHTKNDADKNMWRVPSLLNVAHTAPYFHNGKVQKLEEAVRIMAKTQLGRELTDTQLQQLTEFLRSLSGRVPDITKPQAL